MSKLLCYIIGHNFGKGDMYNPNSIYWQRFTCKRCDYKEERFV